MYRPNLHYRVEQVTREDDKLARLVELVRSTQGPGLVYVATVKAADAVHAALAEAGESVARYHGRLGAAERRSSQDAFMRDEVRVMVATNAFGLGIDKPDIRFVVHYQMPAGLDAYYQESGRAGRDGEPAACTLLYLHSDKAVQQFFLAGRYPALEDLTAVHARSRPRAAATTAVCRTGRSRRLHAALDRPEVEDPGRAATAAPSARRRAGSRGPARRCGGRRWTPPRSSRWRPPTATSARATGRCSSRWCSTARPATAGGRCCSDTSARTRASSAATPATTASAWRP